MNIRPTKTRTSRFALAATLLVTACVATDPDPGVCATPRVRILNGLVLNGIVINGLLSAELLGGALRSEHLAEAIDPEALADPLARDVLEYTVSCALDVDQSIVVEIDGAPVELRGALGLAPQWGEPDGTCDETCQGWVSACLIARTNAEGESVRISLRGDHASLAPTEDELDDFAEPEARYYGDLFAEPKQMHACLLGGHETLPRACGDDPDCAIDIVGPCEHLCDDDGCLDADGNNYPQTIAVHRDPIEECTMRRWSFPKPPGGGN